MPADHPVKNTEAIFNELGDKQLRNIPTNKKLQPGDIKRIARKISASIFDENICSIWEGYITNTNNTSKGMYVNFYFRKKKVALHRLLYCNFVGDLCDDEYLKFNCDNRGKCCNIHHMNKFKYNINDEYDENMDYINKDNNVNINKDKNKNIDNADNSNNYDNSDNVENNDDTFMLTFE